MFRIRAIILSCLMLHTLPAWAQDDQRALSPADAVGDVLPPPSVNWQPGVDYIELVPPNEVKAAQGKVELVVRFLYTSSISRDMEDHLNKWTGKPEYLEIVRKPAIKWPHAHLFAQMFYTLEKLGRARELHSKLYDWIWQEDHYPIYHTVFFPDVEGIHRLNLAFAKANGIDPQAFKEVYFSKEIQAKVVADAAQAYDTGSNFIVNGVYGTNYARAIRREMKKHGTPENFSRLMKMIEYLAESEYQRMAKASATSTSPPP